jgi:hypothetical protein
MSQWTSCWKPKNAEYCSLISKLGSGSVWVMRMREMIHPG